MNLLGKLLEPQIFTQMKLNIRNGLLNGIIAGQLVIFCAGARCEIT